MAIDPVCGMTVDEGAASISHGGKLYYFCSQECLQQFAASLDGIARLAGEGSGTGSEVMRRIAIPMVGGMVSSAVLTLIVIPAIYVLVNEFGLSRQALNTEAKRT